MSYEGDRLKELRAQNKVTQQELSERSGIERDRIAKIETGTRKMSATDAAYLAQALGVRSDDLIAQPSPAVRWRRDRLAGATSVAIVVSWFDDYVEDALYLERRAERYGLE